MSEKIVLVVDDDTAHATMLKTLMKGWGYTVQVTLDGDEGVDAVTNNPFGLVLMDMKMVKMSGMEALAKIHDFNPALPVIIMTAYSSVDTAVQALKIGAYDYLTKPLDFDKLKLTVDRVFERLHLKNENQDLKKQLETSTFHHDILGKSSAMEALLDTIHMVAPTDANVLVTGESGTGKELVAAALHNNSIRRQHPYIRINCAAITETLLESELFGHERGAFTGADKNRKGKFLLADKGSILLDEIGEMSISMQAKLLRVIQEKEIAPVGSEKTLAVDVRVIAATNRDLKAMSTEKAFREDLYYRLNVVHIGIPPLRRRPEDIPELAMHFLDEFARKNRRDIKGFSPNAMDTLIRYEWPGNVRELMNAVERGVVMARTDYLRRSDLSFILDDEPEQIREAGLNLENISLSKVEERAILSTLAAAGGNKSEAARRLGITRKTLLKKLKRYGDEAD
ncbi:two-component system response regulator [Desulfobacter hydrogenophilus]|uniref:Sigma-54-dependent Fis family transcriptional regulator n=1 Tax=Desulfobacter hydrogenophilus TaxID=2291 RepID=A0A328FIB4_9BACT|nr:sigma-54 dependent transcriptional regulator [Desulfobacter hydrogenophilus]NDY71038.1 sigma-54-dependent Fis family transcriptional regulator [Desulfobacter hydrogenophilus]QBH11681.1 sigma-54-dependent Fis family transcriptional regulator [Desulfobacter hydrogenophilus]RAM02893.1 two-component system response regulator [Desulfobacter hydrogenophilus]